MAKIKVTVSKLGDTKIAVDGVVGTSCLSLTEGVERALAGTEVDREYKPEFHMELNEQTVENG